VLVAVIAGGSAGGEAPLSYPQMIVVDLDGRVTFSWLIFSSAAIAVPASVIAAAEP
jgi:hypothetical protein